MIAGSVEELCIQTFLGFYKLNYLSGLKTGKEPLSCPFDKKRDGIIFSEGAAVFILEDLDTALARSADIYAEVLGIGSNFDPFRLDKYNPKGTGIIQAIESALIHANLKSPDIDCIYAHANSTIDADIVEANAIKKIFGNSTPVAAIKSMIGESYSAGGGLALASALGSIKNDFIPPTINLNEKDPSCDLGNIPNIALNNKVDNVMINSFGPNGANSVLIIGRYK